MGLESPSNGELLTNTIIFWTIALVFFILRIANNFFVLRRVLWDDILIIFVFVTLTIMVVLINVSARFATNLFPDEQLASILADPTDVHNRITGSIIVIPLEQCMLLTIWGIKIAILGFIWRMTAQLVKTRRCVRFVYGYVIFSFVVIEVCYYAILCRPFSQYWALPVQNPQCATYSTYSKIQMTFNISSDIMMICLPVSVISRCALPIWRKVALIGLFCMTLFTVLAAILNKYYNFTSPQTTIYALWYIREACVAFWVGNAIHCWQIIHKVFRIRTFVNESVPYTPPYRRPRPRRRAGARTADSAWWNRWYARQPSLSTVQQLDAIDRHERRLAEMGASQMSGATTAVAEHVDAIEPVEAGHIFTLTRGKDDAGPAIAYREVNHIA